MALVNKTFSDIITFTRASTATFFNSAGVLTSAATNAPRFDYNPSTLAAQGLLIEESRTNLRTYSDAITIANSYGAVNATLATVSVATPISGVTTATLMTLNVGANTGNAQDGMTFGNTVVSNTTQYTQSIFVKPAGTTVFRLRNNSLGGTVDFVLTGNGTAPGLVSGIQAATIAPVGNGWYKCTITLKTISGDTGLYLSFGPSILVTPSWVEEAASYQGDGYSGIYIWGAQLEVGSLATSYIPSSYTFTSRANTATYIGSDGLIKIASANTARYNYNPVNLALAPKLLLESANSTNMVTYSEQLDNSSWAKGNATIFSNATIAPDGTMTADKLVENTVTNTAHTIVQSYSFVSGTTYTVSYFVKAVERTKIMIGFDTTVITNYEYSLFDLTAGTVTYQLGTNHTHSITPFGNGWYRCSVTATATITASAGSPSLQLYTTTNVYTGDGTSGVYIWGAQLEVSPSSSSYIPSPVNFISRSSPATYIAANGMVQSATANTARYTYNPSNLTLSSKLLLEDASTNLLTYSEQFENAAWNLNTNILVSSNTSFSPSGTYTADDIMHISTNDFGRTSMAISSGSRITFSLFVKQGTSNFCKLKLSNGSSSISQWFNLTNITVQSNTKTGTAISSPTGNIVNMGNGWVRVSLTVVTTGITSIDLGFASCDYDLVQSTYNSHSYIWGAQLETEYVTSYIATTTSQISRNVDISSSTIGIRAADISSSNTGIRAADISSSNTGIRAADISSSTLTTQDFTIIKSLSSNTIIKYTLV